MLCQEVGTLPTSEYWLFLANIDCASLTDSLRFHLPMTNSVRSRLFLPANAAHIQSKKWQARRVGPGRSPSGVRMRFLVDIETKLDNSRRVCVGEESSRGRSFLSSC